MILHESAEDVEKKDALDGFTQRSQAVAEEIRKRKRKRKQINKDILVFEISDQNSESYEKRKRKPWNL